MKPADSCATLLGSTRPLLVRLGEGKKNLLLSLDRDVFFEIEFCGFVTKLMTVGHVVCLLGRLNPAEPVRKAAEFNDSQGLCFGLASAGCRPCKPAWPGNPLG